MKVTALDTATHRKRRRLGFMLGEMNIPDDFDGMGAEEIDGLFMAD